MVSYDFPNELWLKIVEHLEPHDLRSLLPVNRQLMNIVLNAIYSHCILAGDLRQQSDKLPPFPLLRSDDFIMHHVQEVVFGNDPEESFFTQKFHAKKQRFKKLLEGVPHLQSLRFIAFRLGHQQKQGYVSQKMKIFRTCAATWRHNITRLTFQCHLHVLAPDWPVGIVFPNLSTLEIEFLTGEWDLNNAKHPSLPKFVVPFINDHHNTLTELCIRLSSYRWSCTSPSLVFQELGFLKKLRKLCMSHNLVDDGRPPVPAIDKFLQSHDAQLFNLEVWIPDQYTHTDSVLEAWFSRPLPKLKHLMISGPLNATIEGRMTKWLGRQTDSQLESLTVVFADTELDQIPFYSSTVVPHLLHRNIVFFNLTKLNMDIGSFSVDTLVHISMAFPCLRILSLQKFQFMNHSVAIGVLDRNHVASVLGDWGLNELSLIPRYPLLFEPETKRFIVERLPSVIWFCGMSGDEWIKDNSEHVDHDRYMIPLGILM